MFETSVFHDDLYAMEKLCAADVFGHIVYSEGEAAGVPALALTSPGSAQIEVGELGTPSSLR